MGIKSSYSSYKKNNFKLAIAICLGLSIWCIYDGYFNKKFIEKHTNADGSNQTYLIFNRNGPFVLVPAAIMIAVWMAVACKKNLVADDNQIIINNKTTIKYDDIEAVDKTHFKQKGFFTITHKNNLDKLETVKISDKNYDNLAELLEEIVAKIS